VVHARARAILGAAAAPVCKAVGIVCRTAFRKGFDKAGIGVA
jgi:hypothetical protein